MEMCFVSKGISNYLQVCLGDAGKLLNSGDYYKIRMLEENDISFVISPRYLETDGIVTLEYCVDEGYVLERIFQKSKPDGDMMRLICTQIMSCVEALREYLLVPEDLIISPEYIMYNVASREIKILYVPGYNVSIREQMKVFLEYFMKVFNHTDKQGICRLYDLYDAFCVERLDVTQIRNILGVDGGVKQHNSFAGYGIENVEADVFLNQSYDMTDLDSSIIESAKKSSWEKVGMCVAGMLCAGGALMFACYVTLVRWTILIFLSIGLLMLGVAAGVLFLTDKGKYHKKEQQTEYAEQEHINPITLDVVKRLVPLTNGGLDVIHINKYGENIAVGRGKKETDYRLSTTQISRIHAYIHNREEGVYIEDRGSTNGTYLNSSRLAPYQMYLISKGDIIAFANEEFFAS